MKYVHFTTSALLLVVFMAFTEATQGENQTSNDVEKLRKFENVLRLELLSAADHLKDDNYTDSSACKACVKLVNHVINYRKSGASRESMRILANDLCQIFAGWNPVVCNGYINIELDTVLYILDNKKNLTADRVCGIYLQAKKCTDPNANNWILDITPPRNVSQQKKILENNARPLKILQLTDFHFDPLYKPGSNADCGLGLCCQESNGLPEDSKNAAGYWGDYHVCDTPWHSITTFADYVTKKHTDVDIVYYTGDIISHKSWATSKDHNVQAIQDLYELFNTTFKKTPLFPILGNHEPHPTDFYSPGTIVDTKVSTKWIFELAAKEWEKWLPEDTKATTGKGGYYTVLVKPGFRIIALNSNVCFTPNLWLIYNDEDPYDQLKWLNEVLTEAEKAGEKVHILSHIPPGELQCVKGWSLNFKRIVQRFAHVISAQFNGHTHYDELRLFYDAENKSVTNVAFNAGSFTTFVGLNPNYRLYTVDANNLQVLDYDHYSFNLTKANEDISKSPEWYKLYSLKQAYGMAKTDLDDFTDLQKRMLNDKALLQKYYRFRGRESPVAMNEGCDDKCLRHLLCTITAVDFEQISHC